MITGYVVLGCPVCRATQKDLHLKTVAPCSVRCGKCGHKGSEQPTKGAAVDSWNNEHFDMGGSIGDDVDSWNGEHFDMGGSV